MENYKQASKMGQDLILTHLKNRMKEKKMTQNKLAEILQVSVTTLIRYFKKETQMPLGVYLEICGALELTPLFMKPTSIETLLADQIERIERNNLKTGDNLILDYINDVNKDLELDKASINRH